VFSGLITEAGIAAKGLELSYPISERVRIHFHAVFFPEQAPGVSLAVAKVVETDSIEDCF